MVEKRWFRSLQELLERAWGKFPFHLYSSQMRYRTNLWHNITFMKWEKKKTLLYRYGTCTSFLVAVINHSLFFFEFRNLESLLWIKKNWMVRVDIEVRSCFFSINCERNRPQTELGFLQTFSAWETKSNTSLICVGFVGPYQLSNIYKWHQWRWSFLTVQS